MVVSDYISHINEAFCFVTMVARTKAENPDSIVFGFLPGPLMQSLADAAGPDAEWYDFRVVLSNGMNRTLCETGVLWRFFTRKGGIISALEESKSLGVIPGVLDGMIFDFLNHLVVKDGRGKYIIGAGENDAGALGGFAGEAAEVVGLPPGCALDGITWCCGLAVPSTPRAELEAMVAGTKRKCRWFGMTNGVALMCAAEDNACAYDVVVSAERQAVLQFPRSTEQFASQRKVSFGMTAQGFVNEANAQIDAWHTRAIESWRSFRAAALNLKERLAEESGCCGLCNGARTAMGSLSECVCKAEFQLDRFSKTGRWDVAASSEAEREELVLLDQRARSVEQRELTGQRLDEYYAGLPARLGTAALERHAAARSSRAMAAEGRATVTAAAQEAAGAVACELAAMATPVGGGPGRVVEAYPIGRLMERAREAELRLRVRLMECPERFSVDAEGERAVTDALFGVVEKAAGGTALPAAAWFDLGYLARFGSARKRPDELVRLFEAELGKARASPPRR
jgi:hypothetical protein